MRFFRSRKVLVLGGAVLAAASLAVAGISAASSQQVMSEGTNLHMRVVKTVADSFDSGWHIHPAPAIVQVQEGSFQITQGNCTPRTVGAGETYIETPYVPVRAVSTGRVVWTTTLLGKFEDKLLTPVSAAC